MIDNNIENVSEKVTMWLKWKNKVYAAVILVVGLLGGNADRIPEVINGVLPDDIVVNQEFEDLQRDLDLGVAVLELRTLDLEDSSKRVEEGLAELNLKLESIVETTGLHLADTKKLQGYRSTDLQNFADLSNWTHDVVDSLKLRVDTLENEISRPGDEPNDKLGDKLEAINMDKIPVL